MKFEQIILSSYNANHEYIICGSCKLTNATNSKLRLVVSLDEEIKLYEQICNIEINGIEFSCLKVQLNRHVIVADIKSIESPVYTKQLAQISH